MPRLMFQTSTAVLRTVALIIAFFAFFLIWTEPALAVAAAGTISTTTVATAPATTTTVSLSPLYAYLNEFGQLLLEGLAVVISGWIMWAVNKYLGPYLPAQFRAMLEAKAATALNTALANGMPIALHQLNAWESVHQDVQVRNAVLAKVADYALSHAPESAAKFNLGPDQLALKALAFLPAPPPSTAALPTK